MKPTQESTEPVNQIEGREKITCSVPAEPSKEVSPRWYYLRCVDRINPQDLPEVALDSSYFPTRIMGYISYQEEIEEV